MTNDVLVLKFGGAALKDFLHIERASAIIQKKIQAYEKIIVVTSAMGKTTDSLIAMAHSISKQPPLREQDMLVSVGERISMSLLAMSLSNHGIQARSFTGSQAGIITSNQHSEAKIIDVRPKRLLPYFEKGEVLIIAGFQGVSTLGEITTLGRGGSDTTAVALGVAFNAVKVEFYKDVEGIFSADPKRDPKAEKYTRLEYREVLKMMEQEGVKVIHPRAILLAEQNQIPLHVLPFEKEKDKQGTLVLLDQGRERGPPKFEEQCIHESSI